MRVAFYYHSRYEGADVLMDKAVRSVREVMPRAEIWHLRGPTVEKHPDADFDLLHEPMDRPYHHHLLHSKVQEVLFLDIDCWVQKDVSEVFQRPFDIAVCVRPQYELDKPETWGYMPYNGGVVFSRSAGFWKEFAEFNNKRWSDYTFNLFIGQAKYQVFSLPSWPFNFWPKTKDEDVSYCSIVHYKGPKRKSWMASR